MKSRVLAVALLVAVSGFAQTTTPGGPPVALTLPMVYDANGTAMGQLIDVDDYNARGAMIFQLQNPAAAVTVHMRRDADGVHWGNVLDIYYAGLNCVGDAYVFTHQTFADYAAVVDKNEDLFLAPTFGPTVPKVVASSIYRPDGTCNNSGGGGGPMTQITRVDSMRNYFKTPLHVQGLHKGHVAGPIGSAIQP